MIYQTMFGKNISLLTIFTLKIKWLIFFNFRYKAVEPKNLWNSFDSVIYDANYKSGILGNTITVEEFMRSWTDQAGYPVINIDTTSPNYIVISQVSHIYISIKI